VYPKGFIDDATRGAEADEAKFIKMIEWDQLSHDQKILAYLKEHGHELF
jgi:hypothetical protein